MRASLRVVAAALLLLVLVRPGADRLLADLSGHPDPWYAANALYGDLFCLGVPAGRPVAPGDEIALIVQGQGVASRRVESVITLDEARPIIKEKSYQGLSADKDLWRRMRCAWWFRDADAHSVATLEGPEGTDFVSALGLRELPASFIVAGGRPTPLTAPDLEALDDQLKDRLPKSCRGSGHLLAGRLFGPVAGYSLVEFAVGVPVYDSAADRPIKSISICRFFLKNGGVKAIDEQSRTSGEEERVDTDPPELTADNWSDTQDVTLAYITRDGGCRWERIHSNGGFEGINYVVQSLEEGLPEIYHEYFYTAH